jgi:outer membrane protein assembly factor BamB
MGRETYKTLIIILCCWFASCKKDKPAAFNDTAPHGAGNVYIVCEGNFGLGESSLYAYRPASDSVYGDVYMSANNQPLGDVFQSMARMNGKLFLCVNNSNKIAVVNADTWKLVATISIPDPRYILQVSPVRALVSALYGNKVYVINPETCVVTDTITLAAQDPEGMCLCNNDAFICTWDTADNHVYRVDAATGHVAQAVRIAGYAAQAVVQDKEQMLWVLAGDEPEGKPATWTRIDPSTGDILATYQFPADADPVKPVFNPAKDTLYFIEANYYGGTANNGVYRMGIHDAALPAQPFIAAKQFQYFWALGIDPATGYIYAGDPKGFTQKGAVYIYRPDGSQVSSFNVGIGPGHFYFDQ